jgi:hypothetical protein
MKMSSSLLKSGYLFLVVLLVFAARGLPLWLVMLLMVLALAAPLVCEFKKPTDLDERQLFISHFSSHIAFYVFLGLLLFIITRSFIVKRINPEPEWYALLLVPLAVKFLLSFFQNSGPLKGAALTGYFFAGVWLLFVLLSHGLSVAFLMESIPFLLIAGVAWFSAKNSTVAGIGFLLLAAGLTVFFRGWLRLDVYVRLLMYTLIPLPLLVGGLALLFVTAKEEDE